ncbi:MAG: SpoIID/LytB domain-containing protein [Fusobacteriaceae bacterium]
MKNLKVLIFLLLIFLLGCSNLKKHKTPEDVVNSCYIGMGYTELTYKLGKDFTYFENVKDVTGVRNISNCDEKKVLELYKNAGTKGYGDNSPYWRWSVIFTEKQLETLLWKNLVSIKKSRPSNVYLYKNKKWVLEKEIEKFPLGTLKDIKVIKRGDSTIVMDLLIIGSKNTYVVTKELNIRRVLNFSQNSRGSKTDVELKSSLGRVLGKNMTTFPSAFFSIEKKSKKYYFYGGGFGHGVGMPQYTAYDLTKKKKYDYEEILERYYPNTKLKKNKMVQNFKGELLVGITNNNSLEHKNIKLISKEEIIVFSGKSSNKIKKNSVVEIVRDGKNIVLKLDGKKILTSETEIRITSKDKITVASIKRSLKSVNPSYYGDFIIKPYRNNLVLANKVNIEDYLKGVVVSEMPISFGLEPLKAQAITARTYAMSAFIKNRYKKYGVNLDDTVSNQVYNNKDENHLVNKAIKETKNLIITYENIPVETFFYSTSSGFSATPLEVW